MKINKYIILCFISIVLASCENTKEKEDFYQKFENYNGEIKKLCIYEYASDLEQEEHKVSGIKKVPIIQKEFNEYGKLTFSREVEYKSYKEGFEVRTDSFAYLKDTLLCKHNYSYAVVGKDELNQYLTNNNYSDYTHLLIEDTIKYEFDSKIKSKSFYSKIVSKKGELDYFSYYDYRTYNNNGEIKYKEEYQYENDNLVKITRTGDKPKVTNFIYNDGLLNKKEVFVNGKKAAIYTYTNGKLAEMNSLEKDKSNVKYNSEGYKTYTYESFEEQSYYKSVILYHDSASIEHTQSTYKDGSILINQYKMICPYYYDCNPKITVEFKIEDTYLGHDDLSGFFEKIYKRNITKEEIRETAISILKRHHDPEFEYIDYIYENKDDHGNFLKIKQNDYKIQTRPGVYHIDDDDIFEFNENKIIEKEIEYYK